MINKKRRKFLQLSIITASILFQDTRLLAKSQIPNNHVLTYKLYEDEFLFLYGEKENQGIVEDFNIWTNSSIITRENQSCLYSQTDLSVPDMNPRGSAYEASYSQIVYQKDRFIYPLKRIGKRGEGRWIRIDWNDALKEVAQNIWDTLVNPMYGSQYLTCKTSNLLSESAIASIKRFSNLIGANLDLNNTRKNKITKDIFDNDLIILWGYNPMVSNVQDAHYLQESRYRGAKIVAICPDYNATVKQVDIWLPVKTNSDDIIALKILEYLLSRDEQSVDFSNQDENLVKEIKSIVQFDIKKLTGVHEDDIKRVVDYMVNAKSIKIMCGKGYEYNSKVSKILDLLDAKDTERKNNKIEKLAYLSDFSGKYNLKLTKINDSEDGQIAIMLSSTLFHQKSREYKEKILDKIKYLVCIEERVSETAVQADMILPLKGKYEAYRVSNSYIKPPIGIENVGESRDEWSIFSQILNEVEKIANRAENIRYSKIEDLQEYAVQGFRDLGTIYQEFSELEYIQKNYTLSDNKSVYDIALENENSSGESTAKEALHVEDISSNNHDNILKENSYNLILANSKYSQGIMHNTNRILLRLQRGVPFVLINPIVAKKYDINDGENFKIYNNMGEFIIMAKYSNLVSKDDLIINKAYESYLFKDGLGYGEVLVENKNYVVNIEKIKTHA